jgi:hypothetical protein
VPGLKCSIFRRLPKNELLGPKHGRSDTKFLSSTFEALDEIETVHARHFGFTEEELDFIINYEYRMGRDAEAGHE